MLLKKYRVLATAALVLLIVSLCLILWIPAYVQSIEAARKEQSRVDFLAEGRQMREVGMNESLLLDSREDLLGEEYDAAVRFDWTGSMRLALTDVVLYSSMREAGIGSDDRFFTDPSLRGDEDWVFLLCKISLENIDAESFYDSGHFNVSSIKLFTEKSSSTFWPSDALIVPDYFDGTVAGAKPNEGYHYILTPGETEQYSLGYFVPINDRGKFASLCLGVQVEGSLGKKYQVRFTIPSEVTKGNANE